MAAGDIDYAKEIKDAQIKLRGVEKQLEQLENLKALEPQLKKDLPRLKERVEQLIKEAEDNDQSAEFHQAPVENKFEAPPKGDKGPEEARKAKLRALNKKLKQIEGLKEKGGQMDADAQAKVQSEPELRRQVAALERGEDPDKEKGAPVEEAASDEIQLPADAADRDKRVKAINKKLSEIEQLKKRDNLDKDAQAKVNSQFRLSQELRAIEEGHTSFDYDETEEMTAKKIELDKQWKKCKKKLDAIQALKAKGGSLDADAQAKVASEAALNKEAGHLKFEIDLLNKQERDRVAKRLGWEEEDKKKKNGKK